MTTTPSPDKFENSEAHGDEPGGRPLVKLLSELNMKVERKTINTVRNSNRPAGEWYDRLLPNKEPTYVLSKLISKDHGDLDRVFKMIADFKRLPDWNPSIISASEMEKKLENAEGAKQIKIEDLVEICCGWKKRI
eukprot:jgi/Bigna1/87420/estExt_fgenesh1_pg.C_200082